MEARTGITNFIVLLGLITVGCQNEQVSTEDKLMHIEQEQTRLAQAIAEDKLKRDMLDARLKAFEKNIEFLDEKVARLQSQVERVSEIPEKLVADVDADRVYLKAVRDDLGAMRAKTVEMLDVQNQRIAEGRRAYLQVLEKEMELLSAKLEQMRRAVDELNREMPQADQEISSVMSSTLRDIGSVSEPGEASPSEKE